MTSKSTIYAVSTGPGRAAIAVVRVSGTGSSGAVLQLVGKLPQPRQFSFATLRTGDREVLDQAVVVWLPGPSTVTGEDMAEFHVHGSPAVVERLLRELGSMENFSLAEPGAFTRRAFENDRIDLLEVEGLADLLAAESEAQRRLAMRQFTGEAGAQVSLWRERLLSSLSLIEAAIDFVDEGDVAEAAVAKALPAFRELRDELTGAVSASQKSAAVRRGLRVVIAGAPNVGKSSLLNALAGRRAAIVSPIAGTTRDVVEAPVSLAGLQVILADTAGIRVATSDDVEREGIALSHEQMADADILIWVESLAETSPVIPGRSPDLVILNKSDQATVDLILTRNDVWGGAAIPVSLISGDGFDRVQVSLSRLIEVRTSGSEHAVLVRERHRIAAEESIRLLNDALNRPSDQLELMAEDVRNAARALALVTGRVGVEDVLGKIFSEFCVGK